MADALSLASDLGFPCFPNPGKGRLTSGRQPIIKLPSTNYEKSCFEAKLDSESRHPKLVEQGYAAADDDVDDYEEMQNSSSTPATSDKGDALVRVLRDLTTVQRNLANLQVELQGRKDDKSVAHLTHVSEMEKKCESLSRITTILKDVIQNKDRIIARLQQPYSLDCIPVEAEFQRQFSELLLKAAGDYGALTTSIADFQWSQNFREPPSIWGEMLRPIPVALASCTRFFEAMSATRDSFAALQQLRVGKSLPATPAKSSQGGESECVTPPPWKSNGYAADEPSSDDAVIRSRRRQEEGVGYLGQASETGEAHEVDGTTQRRLSWPPSTTKAVR